MLDKGRILTCCIMLLLVACSTTPSHQPAKPQNTNQQISAQQASTMPSIPVYGNWCGPEHPKDLETLTTPPAPIDELDRLCMHHDYCYLEHGNFNCDCDSTFTRDVDNAIKDRKITGTTAITARSFKYHFNTSPCEGNNENKLAPTRALQKIYYGVKYRVGKILGGSEQTKAGENNITPGTDTNSAPERDH